MDITRPRPLAGPGEEKIEEMNPRKKSMAVALVLWFFLHFLGAHKFYLGKGREARRLILLYFLAPLAAVVCLILVMQIFLGIELPRIAGPENLPALIGDIRFIALAGAALIVLAALWIWDLKALICEVREYNAQVGAPPGAEAPPE